MSGVETQAGNGAVTASWVRPGGVPPTSYDVTASGAGSSETVRVPGEATQATIGGLINGAAYTVHVSDSDGMTTLGSDTSASVTPTASAPPRTASTVTLSGASRFVWGHPVTLTATVTSDGHPAVGGSIQLAGCLQPLRHGRVTCILYLPFGEATVHAIYSGTPTEAAATSKGLALTGGPVTTSTHLAVTGTFVAGGLLVATATLRFTLPPAAAIPGFDPVVQFYLNGHSVAEGSGSRQVVLLLIPAAARKLRLFAVVLSGAGFDPSRSETVIVSVRKDRSSTHLRTAPEPGVGAGRIAAVVTPALPSLAVAQGTVAFRIGGRMFATAPLNAYGIADVARPASSPGTITATYSGDPGLLASTARS